MFIVYLFNFLYGGYNCFFIFLFFFGKFRYSRYCRQIEKLEMKILFSFHRVSNILCRDFTKDEDSCKVAT